MSVFRKWHGKNLTTTFDKEDSSPRSFSVHPRSKGVKGNTVHVTGHGTSYGDRRFTIHHGKFDNQKDIFTFDMVFDDGSPTEHFKGDVYNSYMDCTIKLKDPDSLVESGTGAQVSDYADYRAKVTLT